MMLILVSVAVVLVVLLALAVVGIRRLTSSVAALRIRVDAFGTTR